jgi:tetratricopeptide (TPR) repeat protein
MNGTYSQFISLFLLCLSLVALAQDHGDRNARIASANAALDRGELQNAEREFSELIRDYPGFASAYQGLGIVRLRRGRFQEAQTSLVRALELDPNLPKNRFLLGLAYFAQGNPQQAATEFEAELIRRPREKQALLYLSRSQLLLNKREPALAALKRALEVGPSDPEVLWMLAENDPLAGDAFGHRLLEVASDSYQAHHWQAEQHRRKREHSAAAAEYRTAISKAPEAAGLNFGLARVYLEMADYDGAVEFLNKEITIHPYSGAAHLLLGSLYVLRAEFDAARSHAETALRLGHKSSEAHLLLGRIHARSGDLAQAAAQMEHALELQPQLPTAHYELATIYTKQGRAELAEKHLRLFDLLTREDKRSPR